MKFRGITGRNVGGIGEGWDENIGRLVRYIRKGLGHVGKEAYKRKQINDNVKRKTEKLSEK